MPILNAAARRTLTSGRLAHLVTLDSDGSPQVSAVWTGLEGETIRIAHLMGGRKITNIQRDPRVVVTMEAEGANPVGMANTLIVYGTAHVTEGGAAELLQDLAKTYLGPDVRFPPMDDPPPGHIIHIQPERVAGIGPWYD